MAKSHSSVLMTSSWFVPPQKKTLEEEASKFLMTYIYNMYACLYIYMFIYSISKKTNSSYMFQVSIHIHIPSLSEKKQRNNRWFKLFQMFRSWGEKANLQLSGSLVEGRNHHPSMKSLALFLALEKLNTTNSSTNTKIKQKCEEKYKDDTHDSDCLVWQIKNTLPCFQSFAVTEHFANWPFCNFYIPKLTKICVPLNVWKKGVPPFLETPI